MAPVTPVGSMVHAYTLRYYLVLCVARMTIVRPGHDLNEDAIAFRNPAVSTF